MPERLEYGGDTFPPGDREIWEAWYMGRDGNSEASGEEDTLVLPPPPEERYGWPEGEAPHHADGWEEPATQI